MPIDYSKYPPNWKTEIVPRILKRAGNKCEVCGLENKQKVYSMQFYMRINGRYSYRTIWFQTVGDVERAMALAGKIHKTVRVILEIAHLDHDETNWDVKDERLKAMCQLCHLNYDAKEKFRRKCNNEES